MKKVTFTISIILIIVFIFSYLYNNFFIRKSLVGKYANTNFNYPPVIAEVPYEPDTLILYTNNTFESAFLGNGTYKISYYINGTKIDLTQDRSGTSFNTSISRLYFGKTKIILVKDLNHYYEKIN